MYDSKATRNSCAPAKKKKRESPSPLAQATFDAFKPFINVFDPGLKLRDGDIIHTITKDDWKLFRRHKAGERPVKSDGSTFHPYLDVVRNIYSAEHVHRHVENNEVTYYTSGRSGLGLLYLDVDAHHLWQIDEAKGRDLLEQCFPFGYFRHSGRGQNGYLKVRYSSIGEFNRIASCLERILKRLFLNCGILCDIEVKGTITDNEKSGKLAKLPFSTRYGPELVHRPKWHPHEMELLEVSEDWCFIRLEQFKSKPIVNVGRIERITRHIEAQIDEGKVSRFIRRKESIRKEHERRMERERRLDERSREEALAKWRALSGLPSHRVVTPTIGSRDAEPTQVRLSRVSARPKNQIAAPTGPGSSEGDAFVRNQQDLLPFVRAYFKRHRKFPSVDDALIHLRDHGLFSGRWEDNEGRRATRVGQVLSFIERTFDPEELGGNESEPLELNLCKFSWWVSQKFASGIRFQSVDVRRFDPVSMTAPVTNSVVSKCFVEKFMAVADFCLNIDPLENNAVPTNRFKKLWNMVDGGARWNQRYFQVVRDTLDQAGVLHILDRNHETGKAWRWKAGLNFPAATWKEEQRRLKERRKPFGGPAHGVEELAVVSIVVLNNTLHNSLYQNVGCISRCLAQKFTCRPPPD